MRRHRSALAQFRSLLYCLARLLGDISAVRQHHIARRIRRCLVGRSVSRWIR